ncbi:MAG: lipocalin-like domain-containing protein [Tropicimonas sp.]|uniref:lipocalin-like domain-containing protein n=1 Tax=Tropicimonas sp. TaxID=2067044 RepID=UPI003A894673
MKTAMKTLAALWLCLLSFSPALASEVGVWRLVSAVGVDEESGETFDRFGARPDGYLIFTESGYMSVVINAEGREPLTGNPETATEEQAGLFSTMTAHAGAYEIVDGRLIHPVDVAHDPAMVGKDLIREVSFISDDEIESIVPSFTTPSGRRVHLVLRWQRLN